MKTKKLLNNWDGCREQFKDDNVIESIPACPVSYLGKTSNGKFYYFRARGAHWTLGFGKTKDDAIENDLFGGKWCAKDLGKGEHKECFCAGWMPHHIAYAIIEWYTQAYLLRGKK